MVTYTVEPRKHDSWDLDTVLDLEWFNEILTNIISTSLEKHLE